MSFIVREKWLWIIIGICVLVMVLPYAVILMIFQMPDVLRAPIVWTIIFSWGIVVGYKDWRMDRKKRESNSNQPE